ncbi:MAG: hypothetical protein HC877_12185 [Thioploca sp.]|nr:hypothetical protein [Thioploca sp.]
MGLPIIPRGFDVGFQAAGFRSSTQLTRAWLGNKRIVTKYKDDSHDS